MLPGVALPKPLKRRAARNSRSLQMEVRHYLILLARETRESEQLAPIELRMSSQPANEGSWSRDEIYDDTSG